MSGRTVDGMGEINLVRTYDAADGHAQHDEVAAARGSRDAPRVFLVDRLWPRGVKKEALPHDLWLKDVAPSDDLRHWFGHDPERFDEFERRYRAELDEVREEAAPLVDAARSGNDLVLLYAAKDTEHNQAVVLRRWLNDLR